MTEKFNKIKWINVILALSVALNFFIAGYFVSDTPLFKSVQKKNVHQKRPAIRLVDYFPQKEKRAFRRSMIDKRETVAPIQREIFSSQKEILEILNQKEMDEEKLRMAFKNYQGKNDLLQTAINEMVIERVLKMDYDSRQRMFKRGQKAHEHRRVLNNKRLNNVLM